MLIAASFLERRLRAQSGRCERAARATRERVSVVAGTTPSRFRDCCDPPAGPLTRARARACTRASAAASAVADTHRYASCSVSSQSGSPCSHLKARVTETPSW
eukprot:793630-Prymnesium_polylepis.1